MNAVFYDFDCDHKDCERTDATPVVFTHQNRDGELVEKFTYCFCPEHRADQCVLVRRQDVEVELDRSRLFNTDQSEMRGKLRADLIVPNPAAVTRIIGIRAI